MESTLEAFFTLSIVISMLMAVISFLMYLSSKQKRFAHIFEFWVSYLAFLLLSSFTAKLGPEWVGLPIVGFVWIMFSLIKITSDVVRKNLFRKWYYVAMALGFVLGLLLILLNFPFYVFTFPVALSISLVGISCLVEGWRNMKKYSKGLLHYFYFFITLLFFLHLLDYPFLRLIPEATIYEYGLGLAIVLLLAVILPGITIFDMEKEQQRILEVILKERTLQLERQSKMSSLGEMTANLVHELNGPLGFLLNRNEMLLRKINQGEVQKEFLLTGLHQMEETAKRLMKITGSLKAFSRDSSKDEMQKVKLIDLIEETLSFTSERFLERDLPLLVGKIPDVEIMCQSVQLSQVLLNLLNNAFDAVQTLPSKWVRVDFEQMNERLRIMVIDSGKGIPLEVCSKIMQPFFTTKGVGKGTGLGLSISQQIIQEHNGKLFIDEHALNTTFVIELPLHDGN